MGNFQEHRIMLCLNRQLYLAFIKLQAEKGLGRSYAGLLPFVEGLNKLGYLKEEVYEVCVKKYSEGLIQEKPKVPTKEELTRDSKLKQVEKTFSMVIEQWNFPRKDQIKWRLNWFKKAQEYKDKIPNAKLVLALANGELTVLKSANSAADP
jgi:hypothetical protein